MTPPSKKAPGRQDYAGRAGGNLSAQHTRPPDFDPAAAARRSVDTWDPAADVNLKLRAEQQARREAEALARFRELEAKGRHEAAERVRAVSRKDFLAAAASHMERKQPHVMARAAAAAPVASSTLRPEDVPLPVAFSAGHDPREDDAVFQRASPEEQERLRCAWESEQDRGREFRCQARARFLRHMQEGYLLWLLLGVLLGIVPIGGPGVGAMAITGVLLGALWAATGADRIAHGLTGGAAYFVLSLPGILVNPLGYFQVLTVACCCAIRGMRVEFRKMEGTW